jgi:hypothetical protein
MANERDEAGPYIVGTLNLRNHTAVVDVTYDIKSYRVQGQHNLQYDGTNIHQWLDLTPGSGDPR